MIAVCGPFFFSLCTSLVSAWACEGVLCREVVVGRPTTLAESSHRLQEPPSFDRVPIAAAHTYGEDITICRAVVTRASYHTTVLVVCTVNLPRRILWELDMAKHRCTAPCSGCLPYLGTL